MPPGSSGDQAQPRGNLMPKPALPALLTPLLGRDQETIQLHEHLRRPEIRLITITGPGGVGKTSLALHVAREAQGVFADGVFFVSLASVSDPTLILPTIAQALGLSESPRRLWLESLKDYLHNRQVLLLLDNFEQIITAAPLLTELLSACAGLRLLVTSREALRVRGEQEFLLSPLALPDQPSVETLLACPSVALFSQRAQAAQLDFRLTSENAAAVAEICARLDGLPLALELAAARIKMFPPPAMLARLRDSPLQLLSRGARDLPERQQTLRRAVEWSYDLLDEAERRVFRQFSVFVGGSTLEAALAVLEPAASVDSLDSLVSKSLLRQTESGGAARLVMLETIRQFAWEQLAQAAELEATRRAHAAYCLSLAEEAEPRLAGPDQKVWRQRLELEQDNLRAALRWAIEQHAVEWAQRLAGALQPFWFARGYWSEGRRWLEEALAIRPGSPVAEAVRAKALYGAGSLARYQGDFAHARRLCEQSLNLYRTLANRSGTVLALVQLVRIAAFQEDHAALQTFLAEAAALVETLPDTVVKADAYTDMVIAQTRAGAYPPEGPRYLAESERIQRALNNPAGLAFVFTHQANGAVWDRDYTRAASRFDEAERLAAELGDIRLLSRIAMSRLQLDILEGHLFAARRRIDILQSAVTRGDYHAPAGLPMLAIILHKQGLPAWSARVLGLAEAMTGRGRPNAEAGALAQFLRLGDTQAELRAQLGEEAFAREFAAGRRLTLDDLRAIPHPPAPAPPAAALPSPLGAALTAREIEVLRLLAEGLSNPQIAGRLVVSRRTVDAHLRSIYAKLDVKSRDGAIRAAQALGVLPG